jgi:cardiolipin synthase
MIKKILFSSFVFSQVVVSQLLYSPVTQAQQYTQQDTQQETQQYLQTNPQQGPSEILSIAPQDGHLLFAHSIDAARVSIDMVMFRITDREIVNHLLAAKQRGVKIRIIVDQIVMNRNNSKGVFEQLNAAGIEVRLGSPLFSITHSKAALIDYQWALITSMNLTNTATYSRDYGVQTFDQSILNEFQTVFEADWLNAQNQTAVTPNLQNPKLLWSPINAKDKILGLIDSAQSTLKVEVENLGDNDVISHLKLKAMQGVKVTVIVPGCVEGGGLRNVPFMKDLAASGVDARLSIPPYSEENPYIHAKTIVVDGQFLYVGSENLSYNSLTRARELGLLEYNPQLSARVQQVIDYDYQASIPQSDLNASFVCPERAH